MMNDYKELIEKLRMAGRWIKHDDGSEETYLLSVNDCAEIADAIEQLVKERDEWRMKYAKQERKRSIERSHELAVELDRVKKERDAYAKAFRITTSYEPLINHAVVKVDYNTINGCDREELMRAIAYRLARVIEDASSKGGRT